MKWYRWEPRPLIRTRPRDWGDMSKYYLRRRHVRVDFTPLQLNVGVEVSRHGWTAIRPLPCITILVHRRAPYQAWYEDYRKDVAS